MPLAHHLGEVAVIGLLRDLDAAGALASSLFEAAHDVVRLRLDQREV